MFLDIHPAVILSWLCLSITFLIAWCINRPKISVAGARVLLPLLYCGFGLAYLIVCSWCSVPLSGAAIAFCALLPCFAAPIGCTVGWCATWCIGTIVARTCSPSSRSIETRLGDGYVFVLFASHDRECDERELGQAVAYAGVSLSRSGNIAELLYLNTMPAFQNHCFASNLREVLLDWSAERGYVFIDRSHRGRTIARSAPAMRKQPLRAASADSARAKLLFANRRRGTWERSFIP